MSHRVIEARQSVGPSARRQLRRDIVAGTLSSAERDEILAAFAAAQFRNLAQGVRVCCLAFARSPEIQAAVLRWLHGPGREAR
jgi:hypothetical protein